METGFYDIHTHILPVVDDGSQSPEESREMLQMAYDQGVRHIVASIFLFMGRIIRWMS